MPNVTPAPQPILLTETEAAKILGFSARTLQGWRCRGGGPKFVRVSKACVRYRREDLQTWIEERIRLSTSDDGLPDPPTRSRREAPLTVSAC